jgi:hypothetical protein
VLDWQWYFAALQAAPGGANSVATLPKVGILLFSL